MSHEHTGKMKIVLKIAGVILALCILLVGSCVGYLSWRAHLPSDENAKAFFREHRPELTALILAVEREPTIDFVNANWVGYGPNATDPAHVMCAKLLKKIGAQFLRQSDGAIEIYLWGDGCAICHDSYKGYAYIMPEARMLRYATIVHSLDDEALPKGKYAPIEDGSYICPLLDRWYLIRWECG
jgi:hypothetical protein